MINLRRLFWTLCAVAAGAFALPANAQLTVQITRGVTTPIPIAVVPFGADPAVPLDVASVVEADLARSGRFAGLPRAQMLQPPTNGAALDLGQWKLLRTDFVVVGRVINEVAGYRVEF